MRARSVGLLLVLVLVAALAGCGGSGSDASDGDRQTTTPPDLDLSAPAAIGSHPVGRIDRTWVDDSRPTAAHGGEPELPDRTIDAMVLYPAAGPAPKGSSPADVVVVEPDAKPVEGSGAPVIVFGHGSTRLGEHYERTLAAWASAGYVVVAPNFPLSKEDTPGGTDYGGVPEQAGDESFVIDQVEAAAAKGDGPFAIVDVESIGLGGQSFGAITALAESVNACCADPRVDSATEFAGAWLGTGTDEDLATEGTDVPVLLVHGDADPTVPFARGEEVLALLSDQAQLLHLVGTGHDDGYFDGVDDDLSQLVTEAALAHYDATLKGDPKAEERLDDLVAAAGYGVARLEPSS